MGCRRPDEATNMVRVVADEQGSVAVDLRGRAFGRGAWVHPRPGCLGAAAKRGLSRGLKRPVSLSVSALTDSLRQSSARRVEGLLRSAQGAGKLAVGTEAVRQACSRGLSKSVVIASDARSAAKAPEVQREAARGRAIVWGKKADLGRLLQREETAVVAVLSEGFSDAIARAVALSQMPAPDGAQSGRSSSNAPVEDR